MNTQRLRRSAIAALAVAAAVSVPQAQQPDQGPKPVARAGKAMVSASHPAVTRTMLDVLRAGGNAVDAVVTAVVLQPVLEPQMSTLAGGMSMLLYEAKTGTLHYLDAELDHTAKGAPIGTLTQAPSASGVAETSGRRVGVPGTVAGLHAAAERFGTLKWADYFGPAIRAAETGFPMYSFLYAEMADAAMGRLSAHASGRDEYLPDGLVPPVGALVKRPRLAQTLRRLASDGPDYFYRGAWGRHFVDEVNRTGGSMTLEELGGYEARWEQPLRSTYRGYGIASSPPPATAGTLIAMILNILEPVDLATLPHFSESARTLDLVRHAFALAESNSEAYVKDPRSFDVPSDVLLSKPYAAMLTRLIEGSRPRIPLPSAGDSPRAFDPAAAGDGLHDPHYSDTNHLVAVDESGNWVSVTHTVYGSTFATGLVVDGIGVNSGNGFPGTSLGNGRRVVSPFPPTMVLRDGRPHVVLGSPGLSSRAVALVLVNLLGFGMDLQQAVDAPRFQGSGPGQTFSVEARVAQTVRDELASYGVRVQTAAPYNWHFGSIHAVMRDAATGGLIGVADPRRGGHAEGY